MSSVGTEIVIVLLLMVLNGVFSMSEIAVVSARKARLQQRAEEGNAGARVALEIAEEPTRFLSTVQIGITLIGILTGAFGGATIADRLAETLAAIPALAPYSQALAIGLVVLVITYLSLIIGELVPKRLGLYAPERVAALVARPMRLLSTLTGPAVHLLTASTELALRLLGLRQSSEPPVTEEEITILMEQGAEAGVFETAEHDMVRGVFRLGDRRVCDVMTPRPRLTWLDIEDPVDINWRKMIDSRHSYFPVCEGALDEVLGVVSVKDIWARMVEGLPVDLRGSAETPLFVPETTSVFNALEAMKQSGRPNALVIDEYGGITGFIALRDVMAALVGDIPNADENHDPPAVQREDGSWLLDGMLAVEEAKMLLHIETLPDEAAYQTLGGFIMTATGRIPTVGDYVEWAGQRFEVMDMDGNRVDKVLVSQSDDGQPTADDRRE